MPEDSAVGSPAASWSVASISISHLIVSNGGPLSRKISVRSGSSPTVCGLSERVIESGLYCSMIVPSGMPSVGSSIRMAPLRSSGETLAMAVPRCGGAIEQAPRKLLCGIGRIRCGVAHLELQQIEPSRTLGNFGAAFARQSIERGVQRRDEPLLLRRRVAAQVQLADVETQRDGRRRALRGRTARGVHDQPRVSAGVSGRSILPYSMRAAARM